MLFKDKIALYIIVIVVGAVLLELWVSIFSIGFVFSLIEVTKLIRSTELFFFNNTFETLGVSLLYLERFIGLKNSFLYGE